MTRRPRPTIDELLTDRLRLRGWRPMDAGPLAAMNSDPEVMRYIGSGVRSYAKALAEAEAFIAADGAGRRDLWAIETLADGEFHGWAALMPFDGSAETEIGYRLCRASWGRGIATEAAARLIAHGFEDWGLPRIVAVTAPANLASQRVLEKLGLSFIDARRAYGVDGCLYYEITAAAWRRSP